MCSHTDSQVLSCVPGILVSLTLWTMSNTIFLVEHLVRRENGKRQSLSMFQKVTLLGVMCYIAPVSSCFYYCTVCSWLCLCACVLNSAHVLFMSDCPHVCVCMHNAASQLDRQFSKRAFKLRKDKEHTQVKDGMWIGDGVLAEVRNDNQHTHPPPPWLRPAELRLDIVINGAAGALTLIDTGSVACTHTTICNLLSDVTLLVTEIRRVHHTHFHHAQCLFSIG